MRPSSVAGKSNRVSGDAARKRFVDHTINPKIALVSETLTEWLGPMFGDDRLVLWIEPATANDTETKLHWAQFLEKHSVVTGDELRELCPLGLEPKGYPDAVSSNGRDIGTEELVEMTGEANRKRREIESAFSRLADFESEVARKMDEWLERVL